MFLFYCEKNVQCLLFPEWAVFFVRMYCFRLLVHASLYQIVPFQVYVPKLYNEQGFDKPRATISQTGWVVLGCVRRSSEFSVLTFKLTLIVLGFYAQPEAVGFILSPRDQVSCEGCGAVELSCGIPRQRTVANLPDPVINWLINKTQVKSMQIS